MDNGNIIEVKNLTKMFGKFTAVDDISFDVKKGEIFGLLGPNGAGKSTTLRMLSTLSTALQKEQPQSADTTPSKTTWTSASSSA